MGFAIHFALHSQEAKGGCKGFGVRGLEEEGDTTPVPDGLGGPRGLGGQESRRDRK